MMLLLRNSLSNTFKRQNNFFDVLTNDVSTLQPLGFYIAIFKRQCLVFQFFCYLIVEVNSQLNSKLETIQSHNNMKKLWVSLILINSKAGKYQVLPFITMLYPDKRKLISFNVRFTVEKKILCDFLQPLITLLPLIKKFFILLIFETEAENKHLLNINCCCDLRFYLYEQSLPSETGWTSMNIKCHIFCLNFLNYYASSGPSWYETELTAALG